MNSVYLSYNINDLSEVKRFENLGFDFVRDIEKSSLCVVFASTNSTKSSARDIKKAFSKDIPTIIIYIEDVNLKLGLLFSLKNKSKLSKYSIKKYLLDDNAYEEEYIRLFAKFGFLLEKSKSNRNFRFLEGLIGQSNEVTLTCDIVLDESERELYPNGIEIAENDVVIEGNGHSIDGLGKSRIFDVYSKKAVFKNIVFINGQSVNGGAISGNESGLRFVNCTFKNNYSMGNGGAIFLKGGSMELYGSKFSHNHARLMGGAVHAQDSNLSIENSYITDSKAQFGGALRINYSKLKISDVKFENNISQYGGAINYNESEIIIEDSFFSHNTANVNGGAIETQNGSLNIHNTKFSHNSAKYGSSIRNYSETLIRGCEFESESSENGVLFNKKGILQAVSCNFIDDKSQNHIIYNEDYIKIDDSSFKVNSASNIIANMFNMGISHCKFINNTSDFILKNNGKSADLIECQFLNNNCDMDILNESDLTVKGLKLTGNNKFILNNKNLFIRDSDFDIENKTENNGNIEYIIRKSEEYDFTFLDELIHGSGLSEIILDHDIIFKNYERDFFEGGIVLDIDGLVIDGAHHIIDGSGISRIFTVTSNVILKNIIFKNGYSYKNDYQNPLNSNGGAIRNNSKGNLKCINCEFLNNCSEDKGGAIDNRGGCITLLNCRFENNSSEIIGGALINRKNAAMFLDNVMLNRNMTKYIAGAIENEGHIIMKNCGLTDNSSQSGGAVRNIDDLKIYGCDFINNNAGDGGALNNYKNGKCKISGSLFKSNSAGSGGAIENRGIYLIINDCQFIENFSKTDGGAIFSFFCENFTAENCIFNNNHAMGVGGAILNFTLNSNLNLMNSSLTGNYPDNLFER